MKTLLFILLLISTNLFAQVSATDSIETTINLRVRLMDSATPVAQDKDFIINIDKYRICNVLIRSNEINKLQIDELLKSVLDSFVHLKVVRVDGYEFLYSNNHSNKNNTIDKEVLDYFVSKLKENEIVIELYAYGSNYIEQSNIINNTNHLIYKQRINSIDEIHYIFSFDVEDENLPEDLFNSIKGKGDSKVIYDSIELEVSNCNLLQIDIVNGNKEKSIDTGNASSPRYVSSRIKSLHISLKDGMHCKELLIQKPIGNLPITFNSTFKKSIEKITLWNPICLMISPDIFECVNLQELTVSMKGYKGRLSPLSGLVSLKKLSLLYCHSLTLSQQKELIDCPILSQIEELTITFCPDIKFLEKLLQRCKKLKKLNLDPNTFAMLSTTKGKQYSISSKWIKTLRVIDSIHMVLSSMNQNCDGKHLSLNCVIQNDISNLCIINTYLDTDNLKESDPTLKDLKVPENVSKYLEKYYCLVNEELTDFNNYSLQLQLLQIYWFVNFRNFNLMRME